MKGTTVSVVAVWGLSIYDRNQTVSIRITVENEGKYLENTKHHHITQPLDYENVKTDS